MHFLHSLKAKAARYMRISFQLAARGAIVSAISAGSLAAGPSVTLNLDSSFTVKGHFDAQAVDRRTVHPVITYHKIIQHNGKPFVCVGVKSGVHFRYAHEFFRQLTLRLNGKTLRRGMETAFNGKDSLSLFTESLAVLAGDVTELYGTEVKCLRVHRKWRNDFVSQPSELFFPNVVWVSEG